MNWEHLAGVIFISCMVLICITTLLAYRDSRPRRRLDGKPIPRPEHPKPPAPPPEVEMKSTGYPRRPEYPKPPEPPVEP